jgi:hypothetical protein
MPDFKNLFNQFAGDFVFKKLIVKKELEPDIIFYFLETNKGEVLILEIDFISNMQELRNLAKKVGAFYNFIKVNSPLKFKETSPVKLSRKYFKPEDWKEIKLYANDKYNSQDYYFTFLITK